MITMIIVVVVVVVVIVITIITMVVSLAGSVAALGEPWPGGAPPLSPRAVFSVGVSGFFRFSICGCMVLFVLDYGFMVFA